MTQVANRSVKAATQKPTSQSSRKQFAYWPFFVMAGLYVLLIAAISPAGNFPLNDDWMYSYAVQQFMETGKFVFVGPNCTSCLLHVLLGAGLCKLFGFSHVLLRSSTLLLAFLNTVTVYLLDREFRLSKAVSTFFALVYTCNPLFLNLAFSFMTDVPSLCLSTASILLTLQGIRKSSPLRLNLAGALLLLSIAVRQTNVVLAAASACVLAMLWLRKKHSWSILLSQVTLPVVWFKFVDRIAPISTNHPMAYGWYQSHVTGIFTTLIRTPMNGIYDLAVHTGETAFYVGLLLLPVLIAFIPCFLDLFKKRVRVLAIWFVGATAMAITTLTKMVVQDQNYMPFSQNLLRVPIVGSLGIMGINLPLLPKQLRLALTHVSAGSAVLVLAVWFAGLQRTGVRLIQGLKTENSTSQGRRNESRALAEVFLAVSAAGFLALAIIQSSIIDLDRYYVIPTASLLAFLAIVWRWLRIRPLWAITVPMLLLLTGYSVCAQQDYMSWNRARWAAAQWLESKNISPMKIDAGAEYDFQHNHFLYNNHHRGRAPQNRWRWWSISGEDYIVSFSPIPGYEQIASQNYFSALTMSRRQLLILKREDL